MADGGVDVSIAPNSSVILEPADSLTFQLQAQTSPHAVLTIRNASDERKIAFKVKTTRPLRYLVRPNQGMLGPNGSASIMIILQQKDCDELLRLDSSERQLSNDKFLVQSIYIDDSFYELAKTKSTKELADELATVLARTDKENLSNKKLRCRFTQEESNDNAATMIASAPAGQSSETAPMLARRLSSNSQMASARQLPVENDKDDEAESPVADVSTPEQLTSALLQESKPAVSPPAKSFGTAQDTPLRDGNATGGAAGTSGGKVMKHVMFDDAVVEIGRGARSSSCHRAARVSVAQDSFQEVAALRKKYDELVAFTVQLTAQRDVLISDLEKTYPYPRLFCKSNAESQRVKKLAEEPTGSTLRQRKNGATATATADTHSGADKALKEPAAFGLFHLLVCAIIFFLVGRYF
ncbi:TPA: hypothetical protein N0F65_006955 [Lagenidium giganteum]|uniref:MSP domain-containing protein n=1 Tax=Lagenidium giganteum TaxID=4803 RepID=A0AAV2ZKH9_9STRA|nr:TPA: hypothetical protein N0F65_006955 [Lagenidium giganteum]